MYKQVAKTMFEKFGFNVLPLRGKRPVIEWAKWQTEKQSKNDIESMPWKKATGLGAVMGIDDLRLFDIDGIQDYELVEELLVDLGLPEKYTWVVQSGSGEGFHIYFRSKEPTPKSPPGRVLFDKIGGEKAVYKFKLKKDGLCKHIELRWKDCQTALPPSMHESSGMYSFYYKEPLEAPEYVAAEKVVDCQLNLCDTTTIKRSTSKTEAKKQYIDREKLETALDYLSEHLTDGSYEDWYRIGFALVPLGEYGENYFVKMSMENPNFSDTEDSIRKKFDELIRDYDGRYNISHC